MRKTLHNKHMQLLYNLTKTNQYLNHQGLSKKFRFNNRKVTPQTIQSWFKYFKKSGFNYSHSIIFEKLGLTSLFVLTKDKPLESAFRDNVWELCNPHSLKKQWIANYLVPSKHVTEFKQKINKKKCYRLHSCFMFSPPYHKILTNNNNYRFSNTTKEDFKETIQCFRYYLSKINKKNHENILKKAPFILPVIMESRRNNISSPQIWNAIKKKLGEKTWDYLTWKKEATDEVGIKRVQKKIRLLNNEFNHVVQQIDIDYKPLLSHTLPVFLLVDYNDKESLINFVETLAMKSARLEIYPSNNKALLICYAQTECIKEIMKPKNNEIDIKKVFFLSKTIEHSAFDYAKCFDPKKKEWLQIE